jgi:hypothetical protein
MQHKASSASTIATPAAAKGRRAEARAKSLPARRSPFLGETLPLIRTVVGVGDEKAGSVENVDAKGDVAIDAVPVEKRLRAGEVLPAAYAPPADGRPVAAADDESAVDPDPAIRQCHGFTGDPEDQGPVRPFGSRVVRPCLGRKGEHGEYERERNRTPCSRQRLR